MDLLQTVNRYGYYSNIACIKYKLLHLLTVSIAINVADCTACRMAGHRWTMLSVLTSITGTFSRDTIVEVSTTLK